MAPVARRVFQRHAALLSVTLVGVWAVGLYVHVLGLPFFRDDMVMLLWLRDMAWGRLWVDATGFPYYRPLSFATLKLSELFFGYYEPQFLHAVNLFFHAANSAMLVLLVRAAWGPSRAPGGRTLAALSAGLLYAAYPFTFEVIPTTGPIFQLQAAFFALAASLAYARWRSLPAPAAHWLYLSLGLALVGSFTCEYSVIIPPMIMAVELILWRQRAGEMGGRAGRPSFLPAFYFVFTALYLAMWFVVPKTRSTLPWFWLRDLGYKTLYYVQGLTYPLQPLALPLARALGLSPLTEGAALSGEWAWPAVTLLAVAALAGLLFVFAQSRRLDILILGLAWWGIAVAPMWPTLDWDYTWNGPRLHYIPALGTALVWGSLAGLAWRAPRVSVAARAWLGVAVLLGALGPGLVFLRGQAEAVLAGGKIVDDVVDAVLSTPPGESALVVNFPSWISPAGQTYALGAEGITFLPGYSSMADLVEINSRQRRDVSSVTFTNVWTPWKHNQRFYTPPLSWEELGPALRAASRIFQVRYGPDGLRLEAAGHVQALAPSASLASFDGRVSLVSTQSALRMPPRGDAAPDLAQTGQLIITLDWASHAVVQADWTVFVHVYAEGGALVAQGDGYPLLGLYPLWAWQPGEGIHDIRYIDLPAGLPPGRYRVGVGIYDRDTGARLAALGPDGRRLADDVAPLFEFER